MSGFKTRFCLCAAVLFSFAAAGAVQAAQIPLASAANLHLATSGGKGAVVHVAATPWSWKWIKEKLPLPKTPGRGRSPSSH